MRSSQLDCTALRQGRESLGLTQSDLADALGVDVPDVTTPAQRA